MATRCEQMMEIYDEDDEFYILAEHGFFAYSGADGDLFRQNGLAGWRIRYYSGWITIQKKGDMWGGVQQWNTEYEIGKRENFHNNKDLTDQDKEELSQVLEHLVKHKKIDGFEFKHKMTLSDFQGEIK